MNGKRADKLYKRRKKKFKSQLYCCKCTIVLEVDVDHSGTLDFEEFFTLMSQMMGGWDPVADLGSEGLQGLFNFLPTSKYFSNGFMAD